MMAGRLPWFLFAVSLAANVFFAAGVGYTVYKERMVAESPEARVDVAAERLGLNAEQHEALSLLRERSAMRLPGLRQSDKPLRVAILKQLSQPNFDSTMITEMLEARDEERRPYFAEYAEDLHGFLITLTPEQRGIFRDMAQERGFLRGVFRGGARSSRGDGQASKE